MRPRLGKLMNNVYIPKFKTKAFASFMYGGENDSTYNDYNSFVEKNKIFGNSSRSKNDVILGIETSYNESSASLVNR